MTLPHVENVPGDGAVQRCVWTSTRTCPLFDPVPTYASGGFGSVHVELRSLEPTFCGCDGGEGRFTHPFDVGVEQPAAPEIVQLQIFTVCWGGLGGIPVHVDPVVVAQFAPLYVSARFCDPAVTPVKLAYQSFANAETVAP